MYQDIPSGNAIILTMPVINIIDVSLQFIHGSIILLLGANA